MKDQLASDLKDAMRSGATIRRDVLRLLLTAISNAEIARELSIGKGTVQLHLHQAFEKLGVASRLEAFRVLIDQAIFGNDFDWL